MKNLLGALLPGLIPIAVFAVVSEVWGDTVGLYAAVVLGVAELVYIAVRYRRIDAFVAVDVGLLVVLGVVSIALSDQVFFKLKPGIIEFVFVAVLGISAWGPKNLLLHMALRGEKGAQMISALEKNEVAARSMRTTLRVMTVLVFLHSLLAIAAALWMSQEAWLFVTNVLLFIVLGIFVLIQFALRFFRSKH